MSKLDHKQFIGQKITHAFLSNAMKNMIYDTYYNEWNISESEYPIINNAITITFRQRAPHQKFESWMTLFEQFNTGFLWYLIHYFGEEKWVFERQQVGMYAVDFDGSNFGRYVSSEVGAHVHSVWVIHPDLMKATIEGLDAFAEAFGANFFYKKLDDRPNPIYRTIKYSLKGIMHRNGFYHDRHDMQHSIGPIRKSMR